MYAQVKFTLQNDIGPMMIPANTFVFKTEGSQVATLDKQNKVHWQKIQVGRDLGTRMEVASGLEDGANVIVNPSDDLTEGLQVQAKPYGSSEQQTGRPAPQENRKDNGEQNARPE